MAYEEKIIEHLTKEIEAQANNMMIFRTRANLSVYLGPYVILGSFVIAVKDPLKLLSNMDGCTIAALAIFVICFLALGHIAGRIEKLSWDKCNQWRGIIARMQSSATIELKKEELQFTIGSLVWGYTIVYGLLLASFAATIYLLLRAS